jgi:SAM-dependent methyltransferase
MNGRPGISHHSQPENTGQAVPDFGQLISDIRQQIPCDDNDLLSLFDTYAQEARFARQVFDVDFSKLKQGSSILEVGAGMMLLSCQLQREGYQVTALEPFGEGFSHFARLQGLVKEYAGNRHIEPAYMATTAENMDKTNEYDYAFSINVMEHVGDIGQVLQNVHAALKPGAAYRFICPNYDFPYEPHFNMPTLVSKRLTEKIMHKKIENNSELPDPEGTWRSLNWITPSKVKRLCRERLGVNTRFDKSILGVYLERVASDPIFRQRRGNFLSAVATTLSRTGIFRLTRLLPGRFLPVMDCTLVKNRTPSD